MLNKIKNILSKIIILSVISLISISICMRSELNPKSVSVPTIDSDVYVYIGEQLNNGKIMYKDIFDHRGPLFQFIEYIGIKFSFVRYEGLWIIELVSMFVAFVFFYKVSKLITKNFALSLLTIFMASVPLSIYFINGNYAEEYSLVYIAIGLYYMLKIILENKIEKKDGFIVGFTLSCVCLIKLNLISVWIVFLIFILLKIIKNKSWKENKDGILFFIYGVAIPIIITIIVLLIQGNLIDCIKEYLIFNFKYATDVEGNIKETIELFACKMWKLSIVAAFIDILYKKLYKKEKADIAIGALIYLILCFLVIIMPKNAFYHYGMVLTPTFIIPLSLALKDFVEILNCKKNIIRGAIAAIILFYFTLNLTRMDIVRYKKEVILVLKERFAVGEYELTKYVKEITNPDDRILVLGNECNIYLLTERTTDCKYFYQVPIVDFDESIIDDTINEIDQKKPKVIILKITDYEIVQDKFYDYNNKSNAYKKVNEFFYRCRYEIYELNTVEE